MCQNMYPQFKLVKIMPLNESFGEIALQHRVPRTASIITRTDCHLAVLSYESYNRL